MAFCQCGMIHVYATYSYVRVPCHILSRYETSFQYELNHVSHFEQTCGFSTVWINPCRFKFLLSVNALSHFGQAYGFLPVWNNSCVCKLLLHTNVLSHFEQTCGFSPVLINSCLFKSAFSESA